MNENREIPIYEHPAYAEWLSKQTDFWRNKVLEKSREIAKLAEDNLRLQEEKKKLEAVILPVGSRTI